MFRLGLGFALGLGFGGECLELGVGLVGVHEARGVDLDGGDVLEVGADRLGHLDPVTRAVVA